MTTFGARLHAAVQQRGPLCAGIDPHPGLLHDWGLDDDVAGLERFALTAAEALAPRGAVVKPQSAFYERFGSGGIAVLERLVVACRSAGALVLLDVKRGDIGSTSQASADAYLDPASPLAVDAITASPYLGFGSLTPMVDTARKHAAGLFVLALTSNKEGPEVQEASTAEGTVADVVLDHLRALNDGAEPLGSFGAVIGATVDGAGHRLHFGGPGLPPAAGAGHRLDFGGPVLAPGFGAQGGTVDDLRRIFGASVAHVLPSTSRELLREGPDRLGEAADRLNERLRGLAG